MHIARLELWPHCRELRLLDSNITLLPKHAAMSLPTTPPTTPAHHQGSSFTTLRPVRFPPPKRKRSSVAVVEIPETPWKAKEPSSGGEQLAGELRDLQLEPAGKKRRGERLRSPPPLEVDEDEDEEEELSSDPDQFGVAHVPTSMQRYARSQKRLQQVCPPSMYVCMC